MEPGESIRGSDGLHDDLSDELARSSDRIVNLILHSDLDWVDIEIEANRMRELVLETDPTRLELFELIFIPRFRRIWHQWREPLRLDSDAQPWNG